MPELPEVEIVRRGLDPAMTGKTIRTVDLWCQNLRVPVPASFRDAVQMQKVTRTARRGKYILAFLENGKGFVLHLGMSGRIRIYKRGAGQKQEKHDHVGFAMEDGTRIIFNDARRFGMLFLVENETWKQEPSFKDMGPEPLGNKFNGEILAQK